MDQNLLFLIFATCFFTISVITITIAPIISKAHISFFDGWGTTNCEKLVDDLDFEKSIGTFDEYKRALKIRERQIDECKRHKIYYSLEYSAFIIDVSLGFIIAIIALIHYVEPGNNSCNQPQEKGESRNAGMISESRGKGKPVYKYGYRRLNYSPGPAKGRATVSLNKV